LAAGTVGVAAGAKVFSVAITYFSWGAVAVTAGVVAAGGLTGCFVVVEISAAAAGALTGVVVVVGAAAGAGVFPAVAGAGAVAAGVCGAVRVFGADGAV